MYTNLNTFSPAGCFLSMLINDSAPKARKAKPFNTCLIHIRFSVLYVQCTDVFNVPECTIVLCIFANTYIVCHLREMEIKKVEDEINELRKKLREKERELLLKKEAISASGAEISSKLLTNEEIGRYSRQIIMPQIKVEGQVALKKASVLIVGAGGLGCPCALYLAGAGIGHIGIVDYDEVELNNLHRQLLHSETDIGKIKVNSAAEALTRLNGNVEVTPNHTQLNSHNALDIVEKYDVIIDASDNVATRYLLNDACVLSQKPLVSGSALQWDGQLTVYNFTGGPCYRCVFPKPPPPETVTSCGDGGVIGVVPGVIGVLQALETIKIVLNLPGVLSARWLVFDASDCSFRNFNLREKNVACEVCGQNPSIKTLIDYEQFCGAKANDKDKRLDLLKDAERITAKEYHYLKKERTSHILIDVRKSTEFEMCHIPDSVNIPLANLTKETTVQDLKRIIQEGKKNNDEFSVFAVCRRGNDSQRAVAKLRELLPEACVQIKDIIGGLHAWTKNVDPLFPVY